MAVSLKLKRAEKGYTQDDMAQILGITKEYYNMIENNKRTPSVSMAKKISSQLGVDWTDFFDDEEIR